MTYDDILLIDKASRNALKAATALDRLKRGVECDTTPISAFFADISEVYGSVPPALVRAMDERDMTAIEFLKNAALDLHDKALDVRPTGPFETDSFEDLLAVSVPLTKKLIDEINDLVGGFDIDLDKPIEGAVAI